jgi:hypothetical protein
MSVVIVVKVSEGLVLAADSAASLMGKLGSPQGIQEGVLKTFYNAKKLIQIGDFPIGILTWGQAYIGARTIESLIREWEHEYGWESQKIFQEKNKSQYKVKGCTEKLQEYLKMKYNDEFKEIPIEQQPAIGLIVAGYSKGEFFPEIWRFIIPSDDKPVNQRPDINGKPNFGASWFGLTDAIVRLHFGRDDGIIKILSEKYNIAENEIRSLFEPFQYPVPFAQMPLQDAIDYANYMINVVIGRYRFVLGPEFCGGEIDIAAITQKEFNWISRKSWKIE